MLRAVPAREDRRRGPFGKRVALSVGKAGFKERTANRKAREALRAILEEDILRVLEAFAVQIDVEGVSRAAAVGGNMAIAEEAAGLGTLQANLATVLEENLSSALDAGSHIGARFAPPAMAGVPPTLVQEQSAAWLATRSLEAATGITDTTKEGIRRVLLDQLADAVSPTEAAKEVGRLAGLSPRQATANRNFRSMLERSLAPRPGDMTDTIQAVIDERVEEHRLRLLKERGRAIADTETQAAIQHGERAFYEVAADEGAIDPAMIEVRWMTVRDSRVCPICMPLHGQVIGFLETFHSTDAPGWEGNGPPAHVRCRCYVEYTNLADTNPTEV